MKQTLSFCFLGGLPDHRNENGLFDRWVRFLSNIDLSIYNISIITHPIDIHNEPSHEPLMDVFKHTNHINVYKVPRDYWIETSWGCRSLVIATLKMFTWGLNVNKPNPHNYYFLVDKTCYPLYSDEYNDVNNILSHLCNGNENIQKGTQWISITESFILDIAHPCVQPMTHGHSWTFDLTNINQIKPLLTDCTVSTFINLFFKHPFYVFYKNAHKDVESFFHSIPTNMSFTIKDIIHDGVWDENFFQILSTVLHKQRNKIEIGNSFRYNFKRELKHLYPNTYLKNYVFPNTIHEYMNMIKTTHELIDCMSMYIRPVDVSPVFSNWMVWGNSVPNMLRIQIDADTIEGYWLDRMYKTHESIDAYVKSYIFFVYDLTSHLNRPWWHPLEMFVNKNSPATTSSVCDQENNRCIDILKNKHMIVFSNVNKVKKIPTLEDFSRELINVVTDIADVEFVNWLTSYFLLFYRHTTSHGGQDIYIDNNVNIEQDRLYIDIAKQYKYCLFIRKVIE